MLRSKNLKTALADEEAELMQSDFLNDKNARSVNP